MWGVFAFLQYYPGTTSDIGSNVNKAVNATPQVTPTPTPAVSANEIKVEFKATGEPISLTYWADGKQSTKTVTSSEALAVNPQDSVKFRYYRGFTPDKIQLTVNGKQVTAPNPPAKGIGIEFEINKNNIAQILQSGTISNDVAPATTTTTPPARTATPRPPTPTPTPRATTTPATSASPANPAKTPTPRT